MQPPHTFAFLVAPTPLPWRANSHRQQTSTRTPLCVADKRRASPPLAPVLALLASLLPGPAPAQTAPVLPPPSPDDDDGLQSRLASRNDDDGLSERLAARKSAQPKSAPPKRARRTPFGFFGRKEAPPPPPRPRKPFNRNATSFGQLSESRVYEFVDEAVRRRANMHVDQAELATLMPYDLQRALFDEMRAAKGKRVRNAETPAQVEMRKEAALSKVPPNSGTGGGGGPGGLLLFPIRVISDVVRGLTHPKEDEKKNVKDASSVVNAAAMAHDTGVVGETETEPSSAAAAYAAAAAIATSASSEKVDPAVLGRVRDALASAKRITGVDDAILFVETIGVTALVKASTLLPGGERSSALTALANVAILVPRSRRAMLKVDNGSILRTVREIIDQSRRFKVHHAVAGESALWHTEAVVSGTHLLGSLALARGKIGTESRQILARDEALVKGLQRLAGGLKNGEPEGAARAARRALGALGINSWKPRMPGQRGLRILSIDGGGTRAVMAFEALKQLKKTTGCEIHELFDVIGGTSTGAIVAASIGMAHKTVEEVELLYRDMIGKIFAKHPVNGPKMLLTRAYYDTGVLESTLQRECGRGVFIDSVAEDNMNKVFVVSSIMSRNPKELHVFRNYTHPIGHESRYDGTVEAQMWEGLRASSAAPTFFSEIRINGELHADGAIVANNPTAVALHETKCMYPGVPIEILVSLGNGLSPAYANSGNEEVTEKKNMGWGDVVGSIVASATSTEVVHHAMQDLFPKDKYFRFNPTTDSTQIDETHPETLASFVKEAQDYIRANQEDFDMVARIISPKTPRSLWRRFRDALGKEMQELQQSASDDDLYLPN